MERMIPIINMSINSEQEIKRYIERTEREIRCCRTRIKAIENGSESRQKKRMLAIALEAQADAYPEDDAEEKREIARRLRNECLYAAELLSDERELLVKLQMELADLEWSLSKRQQLRA